MSIPSIDCGFDLYLGAVKLTALQLKKLISEEIEKMAADPFDMGDEPEPMDREPADMGFRLDDEGDMAKRQLRRMCKQARILEKSMGEDDQLEAWVQSKLTLAAENLQAVFNYLEPDYSEEDEDLFDEEEGMEGFDEDELEDSEEESDEDEDEEEDE